MPMMMDAMPTTMSEMSLRKSPMTPRANRKPKAVVMAISNSERRLWKVKSKSSKISTAEIITAIMVSCLICVALSTAITGAPMKQTSTPSPAISCLASLSNEISWALRLVSLPPKGDLIDTRQFLLSAVNMKPLYWLYFVSG